MIQLNAFSFESYELVQSSVYSDLKDPKTYNEVIFISVLLPERAWNMIYLIG